MSQLDSSSLRNKALSLFIWCIVSLLLRTLRYRSYGDEIATSGVIAFLHGEQLPLLLHRPRQHPLIAPISLSKDGDLQTEVMSRFGLRVTRGSTSKGAIGVFRSLSRWLKSEPNGIALIAVDGPRGPRGLVSAGAPHLAQQLGLPYWVCRVYCPHAIRLKSWDRFVIPLPFSRVEVRTALCEPTVDATLLLLAQLSSHKLTGEAEQSKTSIY